MEKLILLCFVMMMVFTSMSFAENFLPEIKAPRNVILTDTSDDLINEETDINFRLQINYSVDEMINRMQYDYEDKGEKAF